MSWSSYLLKVICSGHDYKPGGLANIHDKDRDVLEIT